MSWRIVKQTAYSFVQSWWAVVVIGLLVFAVVYQRWQYTHPSHPQSVKVGDRISPLMLESLNGRKIRIEWGEDSKATIIYAFAPSCAWCKRNLEAMKTVAINAFDYRFIAVSPTAQGLKDYIRANNLTMPVYLVGIEGSRRLGISGTPSTMIIGRDGVVQRFWRGAYVGKVGQEVARVFHITLPVVSAE